jgi:NAD(P)-dependent dehydrogenase (short-subunit alcohol dehydrogenase family)
MNESDGRIIVLSGATRGLGRAMTAGFVAQGHTVLGCGRSADLVEELRQSYGTPHGAPHDFAALDVADDDAVRDWAAGLIERHGAPDLLLNNAALMNQPAPLWEVDAAEIDALLAVNLGGTVNLIRHFLPAMIRAGRGVVVNFSSGWGRATAPEVAPYCMTKWGVEGLTICLASELPQGLAAVPVNPGIIATDMLRRCWGSGAEAYDDPDTWARSAVPFLLGLGPADNGRSRDIP